MTRQEILKGSTESLYYKDYEDNIQLIPTSASITIVQADGTAMASPVASAVCSVDAFGTMSYAMSATNTAELGENFKATFTYIVGTVTYVHTLLFDIVLSRIGIEITDQDLIDDLSILKDFCFTENGIVHKLEEIFFKIIGSVLSFLCIKINIFT